jgi:hypothetical protein
MSAARAASGGKSHDAPACRVLSPRWQHRRPFMPEPTCQNGNTMALPHDTTALIDQVCGVGR